MDDNKDKSPALPEPDELMDVDPDAGPGDIPPEIAQGGDKV